MMWTLQSLIPESAASFVLALSSPPFSEAAKLKALLYLDPGTGSLLFSIIMGLVSTAYFVCKDLLYRISTYVKATTTRRSLVSLRDTPYATHSLVFYSEGAQYESTFRPLLVEMQRRSLPCLYLSSDAADPLLRFCNDAGSLVRTACIGNGYTAWAHLKALRARVVCMTTPGLDVLQLRRSPRVNHYMHIVHSPTDKSFNRPYSFDFFDSMVVNGSHQERVIRALETSRGRQIKEIFLTGCVYYDSLLPKYRAAALSKPYNTSDTKALRVLIAPTWGKNGLLTRFGTRIIRSMAEAGFEVIVRPHPQTVRTESDLLHRIRQETASLPNCHWDTSSDPVDSMAESDILISDISGIVFDYAFLTGRAVLTLDFAIDKRGFEAMDLPFEPWDIECLDIIGRRIQEADISSLESIVREEAADSGRTERIRDLRERYVVNFGHASESTVDIIARLAFTESRPKQPESMRPASTIRLTPIRKEPT